MKTIKVAKPFLVLLLLGSTSILAQNQKDVYSKMNKEIFKQENTMKTYIIEREIPDAGKLTPEQLKGISEKSNEVLSTMGPGIQWVQSYVTDNKVYCVYKADNEILLREHAEKAGFPANKISEFSTIISPETAKD